MPASIRNFAGAGAALMTIALVLAAAISSQPASGSRHASADCPYSHKAESPKPAPAGA